MNLMRKNFALAMVALLSLTIALAAVSCGQKTVEETPATTGETMPPADNMMVDSTMMDSTAMMDTTMHH